MSAQIGCVRLRICMPGYRQGIWCRAAALLSTRMCIDVSAQICMQMCARISARTATPAIPQCSAQHRCVTGTDPVLYEACGGGLDHRIAPM